jgi:hypothetical protein
MNDGCPEPDVELDASRFSKPRQQRRNECFCYRATLNELLADDVMEPVLRTSPRGDCWFCETEFRSDLGCAATAAGVGATLPVRGTTCKRAIVIPDIAETPIDIDEGCPLFPSVGHTADELR